ncbi:MAG: type II toxin-antitoxin system VapC family toxin, partial [Propionibacteriaceae bacterium]|nr:type II toxin-antitoxin system VapC family toxin [Propionibacteriaceae bacterium]
MTRPASAPLEPGRRITVDTNVLVRAVTTDDPVQSPRAAQVLAEAAGVVVTLPCWCEFVWVLRRAYGFDLASIEQAITALVEVPTVLTDRPAVAAGLALLRAGGDFADGVIAHLGALA